MGEVGLMESVRPQATYTFTKGFMWGCATAAHQMEGDNTRNDWWAWEQQPGRILNGDRSGLADDWWGGRWREDFDRAEEDRHNAHRLSVEWSRIQPEPDRWDEYALDLYREMVKGLRERGMAPLVTLWHFTLPQWVAERGGWENEATIGYYEAFVRKVVEALKPYVSMWVTENEPNLYASEAYIFGHFPPGKSDVNAALQVMINLIKAHAFAFRLIHALQPQSMVGIALNYRSFKPARPWLPLDGMMAKTLGKLFNDAIPQALCSGYFDGILRKARILEATNTQDYLGIDYYTRDLVAFNPLAAKNLFMRRYLVPGTDLGDTGFLANVPEGMFEALRWARQFGVPIIVTENGIEDGQDDVRRRYLVEHLHQMWRAVNFSWPIKGYFHWSLVDNFEWERGWSQRFGLYELDRKTQARRKRKSADLYSAIIHKNGISSETVAQYTPEIFDKLFPGGR
jgi:beta-glucosidase